MLELHSKWIYVTWNKFSKFTTIPFPYSSLRYIQVVTTVISSSVIRCIWCGSGGGGGANGGGDVGSVGGDGGSKLVMIVINK